MKFKKAKKLFHEYNDLRGKDNHTFEHCLRVEMYSEMLCDKLGLERTAKIDIVLAARYHDIGKICLPEKLLDENHKFTKRDLKKVQKHAKKGYNILKAFYGNENIAGIVLHHHERIDGSGYPKKLKEEEIPLGSRIIAVADTYDAMSRHYCLKTEEEAIAELKKNKGKHFDEKVIDAFLEIIKD